MKTTTEIFEKLASRLELEAIDKEYTIEERAMIKTIIAFADTFNEQQPNLYKDVYNIFLKLECACMN